MTRTKDVKLLTDRWLRKEEWGVHQQILCVRLKASGSELISLEEDETILILILILMRG